MKKYLLVLIIMACLFSGCGTSNQATVDVLERCKVINSTITETSISANNEYFTITFENGLFYCEDKTTDSIVYTIKIPDDSEFDMYSIIKSIASNITEEDFEKLETDGEVHFNKGYRIRWHCYKSIEGNTVKYVIK